MSAKHSLRFEHAVGHNPAALSQEICSIAFTPSHRDHLGLVAVPAPVFGVTQVVRQLDPGVLTETQHGCSLLLHTMHHRCLLDESHSMSTAVAQLSLVRSCSCVCVFVCVRVRVRVHVHVRVPLSLSHSLSRSLYLRVGVLVHLPLFSTSSPQPDDPELRVQRFALCAYAAAVRRVLRECRATARHLCSRGAMEC